MRQKFLAEIQKHEGIDGTYVEIPFDVEAVFGGKRIKVKAYFDGTVYRGSIVRMASCYMIGITQAVRREIGKKPGDIVTVEIEKDEEERVIEIPKDFSIALNEFPAALDFFVNKLSFSHQKEYVLWIVSAKKNETRIARIQKSIVMLAENKNLK